MRLHSYLKRRKTLYICNTFLFLYIYFTQKLIENGKIKKCISYIYKYVNVKDNNLMQIKTLYINNNVKILEHNKFTMSHHP